jgi:hypothetical protein
MKNYEIALFLVTAKAFLLGLSVTALLAFSFFWTNEYLSVNAPP